MALVTLAEAKEHLRIAQEDTAHDVDITAKMLAASEAIVGYLAEYADPLWDETTAPELVKLAVLWLVTHFRENLGEVFEQRDEEVWAAIGRLLLRLRTPTLA